MKNKKTAGISLVALVITIIVLIILTGAVIVTFMEGGIVDKAKEAVFKSDIRTYQEILAVKNATNQIDIATGNGEGTELNATELDKIQEIIPEFKEEYAGLIAISNGEIVLGNGVVEGSNYEKWLLDLGITIGEGTSGITLASIAKVGQYVAYIPEDNNETSYFLKGEESGYCDEDTQEYEDQTIERQSTINWRVLKNDGKQVTLISETPVDSIGLGGGNVSALPELLDEIYSTLYSGSKSIKVRNLNIEDVNEAMKVEIGVDVIPYYYNADWDEVNIEKEGATFGDAIADSESEMSWYVSDSYKLIELEYYYPGSTYEERNKTEEKTTLYNMIFKDVADTSKYASSYWLSSSSIYVTFASDYVDINLRCISDGNVSNKGLDCDGATMYYQLCGRPIIVLKSDVIVTNPTAGGNNAKNAWQIN